MAREAHSGGGLLRDQGPPIGEMICMIIARLALRGGPTGLHVGISSMPLALSKVDHALANVVDESPEHSP